MARITPASGIGAGHALFWLDVACIIVIWPMAVPVALSGLPAGEWPRLLPLLLFPVAYLLFLFGLGLYRREALIDTRLSLGRVPFAAGLGGLSAAVAVSLLPGVAVRHEEAGIVALFAAAVTGLSAAGCLARMALAGLRSLGFFRQRVLIIGAGPRAWDLYWLLRKEGRTPIYDVGFVHGPEMGEIDPRLLRDVPELILQASHGFLEAARHFGADQIVVAPDERRGLNMKSLLTCRTAGFPVSEYMRFLEREIGRIDVKRLDMSWLLYSDGFNGTLLDRAVKRLLDVVVSLVLLIASSPALLMAALAVKLSDGGPVFYRQNRVTQDGRVFQIMKLRTMGVDAERKGATWAAAQDPRVTTVGRFLRRTRLDELPQLFNVLRGDMAFVGPRPERPEFTETLAARLPLYDERHRVKAGLTGWAQVNYPYGASLDDARSKLSYDLYYVKNSGVVFDMLIIMQTLRVVIWPGSGVR